MNYFKGAVKIYRSLWCIIFVMRLSTFLVSTGFAFFISLGVVVNVIVIDQAVAQQEDDYFEDEEEPYDEPYIDPVEPTRPAPDNMGRERAPNPAIAPSMPTPSPMSPRPRSGSSPSAGSGVESIEFRLVDPPKYWKPKKRKFQYKKKASNK
jgi:hypothetical protein